MTLLTYLSYDDTYHTLVFPKNSDEFFDAHDSFDLALATDRIQELWIQHF